VSQGLQIGVNDRCPVLRPERPYRPPQDITGPFPTIDQGQMHVRSVSEDDEARKPTTGTNVNNPQRTLGECRHESTCLKRRSSEIAGPDKPDSLGFGE
jgi:hypothetical protein